MPTPTKYSFQRLDHLFGVLSSGYPALEDYYNDVYLKKHKRDRLANVTMAKLAQLVANDFAVGKTDHLTSFFQKVDVLLSEGDKSVQNLIVTGLFETLQAKYKGNSTYHHAYDTWLQKKSLKMWRANITIWEGPDWEKALEVN